MTIDEKLFTLEEIALLKELHSPKPIKINRNASRKAYRKAYDLRKNYVFVPHAYFKINGNRILPCDMKYIVYSKKGKYIGIYSEREGLKK